MEGPDSIDIDKRRKVAKIRKSQFFIHLSMKSIKFDPFLILLYESIPGAQLFVSIFLH